MLWRPTFAPWFLKAVFYSLVFSCAYLYIRAWIAKFRRLRQARAELDRLRAQHDA